MQKPKFIHIIFLPLEKTLTLRNIIIPIKLVFKKIKIITTIVRF